MTDKERLELAAKAAGVPAYWSTDGTIQNRPKFVVLAGGGMGTMPYEQAWNPLTDAGDRYRLAKQLSMTVDFCNYEVYTNDSLVYKWLPTEENGDARAILECAAEIGKAL